MTPESRTCVVNVGCETDWARQACSVLKAGGLVAFPTETVYGLGACAGDQRALRRIFEVKQRPTGVPLILHVNGIEMAKRYTAEFPAAAVALAQAFWPGPLTLVLSRSSMVSDVVSGQGGTVAVRAPAHDVALRLIDSLREAIAAPSANPHKMLPPVRSQHVLKALDGRIEMVLDGGKCPGGLESTVVDLTGETARILRRGAVALEAIRAIVAVEDRSDPALPTSLPGDGWLRVLELSDAIDVAESRPSSGVLGIVARQGEWGQLSRGSVLGVLGREIAADPTGYAEDLYDVLHELRDGGCDEVIVVDPPEGAEWNAIRDRLRRLAAGT